MIDNNGNGLRHPDLTSSRITKDEEDVEYLVDMLENIWFNPFTNEALDLCNLSTSASPEKDLVTNILTAKEKGDQAFVDFLLKRLSGDRTMKFFDILPKIKLKPFSTLKSKKIVAKDKEIMLKVDKNLFGMITVISESRNLDMKKFCHIHWAQYLGHLQLVMTHCVKQTKQSGATILKKNQHLPKKFLKIRHV